MANVLIADDDADSRELLGFALTHLGHEVTAAHDGAEALTCARNHPPDLIISDILMPEMDGFDLCREVKRDERLRVIPFIFYTATYVSAEDEKLAMELGGSGFIRKANDADEFVTVLDKAIHQALDEKTPAQIMFEEAWSYLDKKHDLVVTKKLTKKLEELQAERTAHQESLELLQAIFDAALSAIIAMDAEGKIIAWNRSATRIFGYEASEALGNDLHGLIAPESCHEKVKEGMQHYIVTGKGPMVGNMVEQTAMRKDKTTFPVALRVASFRHGNAWHAAATVNDITERKQVEHQLAEQLSDLTRWHDVTMGREMRIIELKREVNELLGQAGQPPRYSSVLTDEQQEK